jgi:hypothetical protein
VTTLVFETRVTTTGAQLVRLGARMVAVGLFVWAGLALVRGSTIVFQPNDGGAAPLTVQCGALVGLFGDQPHFYSHGQGLTFVHFHVSNEPDMGLPVPTQQIEAECDRERLASAGLIGVLSGPAAVLAVTGRRSRRDRLTRSSLQGFSATG